jgi:hypothetical protein
MGRVVSDFVGDADLVQKRLRALDGLRLRQLQHMHRGLDDILEHGHMGPQVEALEHHAETRANPVYLRWSSGTA